jgi:hypothetical protein
VGKTGKLQKPCIEPIRQQGKITVKPVYTKIIPKMDVSLSHYLLACFFSFLKAMIRPIVVGININNNHIHLES